VKAFGKYKRVMTSVYPDRRVEFGAYEDDIIDIYTSFGCTKVQFGLGHPLEPLKLLQISLPS
jgi:hypothetical protein